MKRLVVGAVAVTALFVLPGPVAARVSAPSDPDRPSVRLVHVAGLDKPTAIATRTGDSTLYVAKQGGQVVAVRDGNVVRRPVLDIGDRVSSENEQGLLGLTFSPDGNRLFVHYTNRDGNTRVEAYDVTQQPGRGWTRRILRDAPARLPRPRPPGDRMPYAGLT